MRHHRATLLGRQFGGLVEDVAERAVQLADVVEERDSLHAMLLAFVETGRFGQDQSVGRDTTDMGTGVAIVRIDRIQQRLQRCRAQTLRSGSQGVLADGQPARRSSNRNRDDLSHYHFPGKKRTAGTHNCNDYIHA